MKNHRWNSPEFLERTNELYRTELHKLYPSEAWALYRVIPGMNDVLDLGCGNGAMCDIIDQISPNTEYTGVDHQEQLMATADCRFPSGNFVACDLEEYISACKRFDCVMSWSVIKSFGNWRSLIEAMCIKARKRVVFDLRVANVNTEVFDDKICWAEYGEVKGAHVITNYSSLKNTIKGLSNIIKRAEIVVYESGFNSNVKFSIAETRFFLATCVLHIKDSNLTECNDIDFYEQLPKCLNCSELV